MAKRALAIEKAWRVRKREKTYKGVCPLCKKPVWAQGKKLAGRWYHTTCWIAKKEPERLI